MAIPTFDPYRAVRSAEWQQRLQTWRARPGESAFRVAALLALGGFGFAAVLSAGPGLIGATSSLWAAYPQQILVAVAAGSAWTVSRRFRMLREAWQRDWLTAQPIAAPLRQSLLGRAALQSALAWALPTAWLLQRAQTTPIDMLTLTTVVAAATGLGAAWGLRRSVPRVHAEARATPFSAGSQHSLAAWQWAEAGASLAPARMAPLLLVLLLIPRGPWMLILPGLFLIAILSLARGWQLSVGVIPKAERWLQTQPLRAAAWLRRLILVPVLLGALLVAILLALFAAISNPFVAMLIGGATLAALTLQWAVTVRWRRTPHRIPLQSTVQLLVFAAAAQAMPIVVPLIWMAQMIGLLRKGWR